MSFWHLWFLLHIPRYLRGNIFFYCVRFAESHAKLLYSTLMVKLIFELYFLYSHICTRLWTALWNLHRLPKSLITISCCSEHCSDLLEEAVMICYTKNSCRCYQTYCKVDQYLPSPPQLWLFMWIVVIKLCYVVKNPSKLKPYP